MTTNKNYSKDSIKLTKAIRRYTSHYSKSPRQVALAENRKIVIDGTSGKI